VARRPRPGGADGQPVGPVAGRREQIGVDRDLRAVQRGDLAGGLAAIDLVGGAQRERAEAEVDHDEVRALLRGGVGPAHVGYAGVGRGRGLDRGGARGAGREADQRDGEPGHRAR
jgi:hypothetical protein